MAHTPRRIHPDYRNLARTARAAGWSIELRKSGHLAWIPPNGRPVVTMSATPSDPRHLKNARADLRRAGLEGTR